MKAKSKFEFFPGFGRLNAKRTPNHVIHDGRICLPKVGQCFVDGHRARDAKTIKLEVRSAQSREIVATMTLRVGTREGTLKMANGTKFAVVGVLKQFAKPIEGYDPYYLSLRLPEVKVASGWMTS